MVDGRAAWPGQAEPWAACQAAAQGRLAGWRVTEQRRHGWWPGNRRWWFAGRRDLGWRRGRRVARRRGHVGRNRRWRPWWQRGRRQWRWPARQRIVRRHGRLRRHGQRLAGGMAAPDTNMLQRAAPMAIPIFRRRAAGRSNRGRPCRFQFNRLGRPSIQQPGSVRPGRFRRPCSSPRGRMDLSPVVRPANRCPRPVRQFLARLASPCGRANGSPTTTTIRAKDKHKKDDEDDKARKKDVKSLAKSAATTGPFAWPAGSGGAPPSHPH